MLKINLDSATENRLIKLSEETNRSVEFFIQQALDEYLLDIEDALSRIKNPKKLWSLEDLENNIDV